MAQLSQCGFSTVDASNTTNGVVSLTPSSNRNGLVTVKGAESTPTVLDADAVVQATLSVRPGRAADLVNNTQRIKRKFIMKVRLPVTTPGLVSGTAGTITDYIDIDLTVSTPVEATEPQIRSAIKACDLSEGIFAVNWVEDMLLLGYEPY